MGIRVKRVYIIDFIFMFCNVFHNDLNQNKQVYYCLLYIDLQRGIRGRLNHYVYR